MQPLTGSCGIVTDVTSPIGRAVARELGLDGARVAVAYRDADWLTAERLVREVISLGGEAVPLRLPIESLGELEQAIEGLVERWHRLDFVVDLDGQCALGRATLPWLLERGRGRIVHISPSDGSRRLQVSPPDLRALAARGIAINSIYLADVRPTRQSCVRAEPEDVAAAAYFLLTQDCCVTGQVIDLSGIHRRARRRRQHRRPRLQRALCSVRWQPGRGSLRRRR
jgi:enoyl-[acyl-carrier-protein] reductase (NADH)